VTAQTQRGIGEAGGFGLARGRMAEGALHAAFGVTAVAEIDGLARRTGQLPRQNEDEERLRHGSA
jgi:hypothetical protein